MNLLASALVVGVTPVNLGTLLVRVQPEVGSMLFNRTVLENCLNEFKDGNENLTGWRAYSDGVFIEIYLHGNIDWEGGSKWL